ncbi:MAG: methionyl-tRNA formyltransferase [Cyclobacteriaceae bacterium]
MEKSLRIVFLGTPEFAVESLRVLVENKVDIVAVVTAPDKPKGRGKQLGTTPVKDYAVEQNLPVLQPTNLKSPVFLEELASYKADLQIVVAFRMLPEVVWSMPPLGTFNLHASLLPQYRGAAPINWAIINGEKETGVTTFFLKHEIDTGKIIFQEKEPIHSDDTVGSLYDRLMKKGGQLVLQTVQAIEGGDYPEEEQVANTTLKHAPKIFREDCEIDWNRSSEEIRNFVRGLNPYPGAWTFFGYLNFKIFEVKHSKDTTRKSIGEVDTDNKTFVRIRTNDGTVEVTDLQLQGKKRMRVEDFLRGFNFD